MSTMENSERIILEFGHTPNSPNYSRAVQLAKSMSSYSCEGWDSQLRHQVTLTESESDIWFQLYEIVQMWKASRVIRGNLSESAKHNESLFRCYIASCKSADVQAYCQLENWIGCQKLRLGRHLLLSANAGKFNGKEKFEPNKDAIRNNVIDESSRLGLCPAFNLSRINSQIDKLPSTIDLHENTEWESVIEPEYSTGVIRLSGISLKPKSNIQKGPEVENIDELNSFGVRRYGSVFEYKESWEHKIITLSESEWSESAHNGIIPQIAELGGKGWQLLTIFPINHEIHCIFQRRRPD